MSYAYGTKGAPAVGGGLPGLPRRSTVAKAVGQLLMAEQSPGDNWVALDAGIWDRRLAAVGVLASFSASHKLANPAVLPTVNGFGCSFSPDGVYLSVVHDSSPLVTIYKRSGDTFTKLAEPAVLPTGIGRACSFSPDGTCLSVAHDSSPSISIYIGSVPELLTQQGKTAYLRVE